MENHIRKLYKYVAAQSIEGFNINMFDSSMSDKVEREVKDESHQITSSLEFKKSRPKIDMRKEKKW